MKSVVTLIAILFATTLAACSEQEGGTIELASTTESASTTMPNPFLEDSPLFFSYPQFDRISNTHYGPAFERGMAEQLSEVETIANQQATPDFDNTIIALERSGQLLDRVARVFFSMSGAHTNDDIKALEQELAPKLSAHQDNIMLNQALFNRVVTLYEQREELGLDAEQQRLLELYHRDFIRAGAALSETQRVRLREINAEMAELQTRFSQQVLEEMNELAIVVNERELLTGMSDTLIQAAADEAESRDMSGQFVIPLLNTSGQPALANLQNRELRERILTTSLSRGNRGGALDTRQIVSNVLRLRAERAQMLGYDNHAEYILENQTAGTVEAVNQRLAELIPPAVRNAQREADDLQQMVNAEGDDFELAAWDWSYYSEKLRADRYSFDESQLQPYFELNNVLLRGVFYAAEQLYGITFSERTDLPVYQEDVRVFEVFEQDGSTLALFIGDFYARPSKRGGAWMNAYVSQSELMGTEPVVANHQNITKPPAGQPTLMTFDEVTTMFHEFGHALHGMFSSVNYPYFAGTSVPRDFVEYPSQVNEMWATWPEVLANYALHYQTGEPMPAELLERFLATQQFNEGYGTTEYLAASLVDQRLHQLEPEQIPTAATLMEFEAEALADAGFNVPQVPPRYRVTYFNHIMGGYSAGYYSYIWSEVLDADTVKWFEENDGLLRANGDHFRDTLLSQGGRKDAMQLFRDFRGRDADVAPLLERRGLN